MIAFFLANWTFPLLIRRKFPIQRSFLRLLFAVFAFVWPIMANAAPLDEFLTALPGYQPKHGEVEMAYDIMVAGLDVFGVREFDQSTLDYHGGTLRGGLALTRRLWVDGAVRRRSFRTQRHGKATGHAVQGAVQFQATFNKGLLPAVALRLSGWGDFADEANKRTPSTIGPVTVDSIRVNAPQDIQGQIDVIGTWQVTPKTTISLFIGGGKSQVRSDGIDVGGLRFRGVDGVWEFSERVTPGDIGNSVTMIDAVCVRECGAVLGGSANVNNIAGFLGVDASLLSSGLNLLDNIDYDANYFQTGASFQWFNDQWRARLGYRYLVVDRGELDEQVRTLKFGGIDRAGYDNNHFFAAELGYKVIDRLGLFIRGQTLQHQFLGEIPFSYTFFSAHKFNDKYGFLSFGMTGGF